MASMMSAQTTGGTSEEGDQSHLNNTQHHLGLGHHNQYSGTAYTSNDLVDPSGWEYYERQDGRSNADSITSQANSNYTRPWEMDTKDSKGFEPFSKLPSFQSQFHAYGDSSLIPEPSLPQPVPVPVSPSSASPGNGSLTQLTPINPLQTGLTALSTPSFHTLTAVNTRPYPLVPAPIQARDIPSINQQYLDERHIQLYQPITTFNPQNVVTVIKKEPGAYDLNNGPMQTSSFDGAVIDNTAFHNASTTTVPAPTTTIKVEKVLNSPITRVDARKKERRKIRASSLESSAESESSAMEIDPSNPGQVDAVSSTANFKSPMSSIGMSDSSEVTGEKQTKKKRKRCGECIGCQKKDNCGDCAPCRNDKSHQICKQRRCEKLTDKKLIYGPEGQLVRGESRRGRGKGRNANGQQGQRGRKPTTANLPGSNNLRSVVSPRQPQPKSAISPAPAAAVPHPSPNTTTAANTNPLGISGSNAVTPVAAQQQQQQQHQQSAQAQPSQQQSHQITAQVHTMKDQPQQPMAPMAFYPTWQTDPSQGWQNQFIQQIPQNTPAITSLNSIEFQPQSYTYQPNGYVQTGIGFDPNYGRTYAAPVQRYEFQTQQIAPINQVSLQSVSFAPTVTYAGQVSTAPAPPVVLPNAQQQQQQTQGGGDLSKTVSGNDMPGYPRVNSVPPRSLNCNGYSGEFGGNQNQSQQQSSSSSAQHQHQQQQQQSQSQQPQQQQQGMHPPQQTSQAPQSQQQVPQSPSRSLMSQNQRHVSQSPNHIPQSPSSHMQQYPIQPSPNHSQQMIHNPHQGMHTPNPQQQQQPSHTPSPSHAQMNQDWNWNNQQQGGGPSDMFNQADRVNLNTRLKTMILRKNDPKDMAGQDQLQSQAAPATNNSSQQSQSQTGHFLSYSHHLRGDSLNANGSSVSQQHHQSSMPGNNALPEPLGGGGDQIWKPTGQTFKKPGSFQTSEQQPKLSNKNKTEVEKSINDPGGGGLATIPPHPDHPKSDKSVYPGIVGFNPDHSSQCYPAGPPGQFHIKQEPGLSQTKMEGYERNYQNFIQYADYCQTQVQGQTPGQDYQQQQQNYQNSNFYSSNYQNFPTYGQSYQQSQQQSQQSQQQNSSSSFCPPQSQPLQNASSHSKSSTPARNAPQSMLVDMDRKPEATAIPPQINYEKEIPAHAYPIPNRFMQHPLSGEKQSPAGDQTQENMDLDKITGYPFLGEGGPAAIKDPVGYSCCRQGSTRVPTMEHLKDGSCVGLQTKDEILEEDEEEATSSEPNAEPKQEKAAEENSTETSEEATTNIEEVKVKQEPNVPLLDTSDRLEKGTKPEVPDCDCFPSDKNPPEPGSYYTHLGSSATLAELRKEIEDRCGISGRQLRIEKVVYTGKEGKTTQGCPLAKWIIRRADPEEKILCVVKRRQGHKCKATFIVVCMVAWDGMPRLEADNAYKMLIGKLNKYGLPTTRRCATNENRTCACQGLDPETSGASYSFGCSWSMYYNGCKYARSKTVRKFRLSVKSEETEIEDHMNVLATILSPLFQQVAPRSYDNQVKYEKEAPECRLGLKPGKPFSGVTACLDFCAHAHRDLHNMQDGCTVQVALLKPSNRDGRPPDDEQFHILPLYIMDSTDEFGSAEGQKEKNRTGAVQALEKFPCEVRVRSTPLQPCRRHGKKRNGKEIEEPNGVVDPPQQQPQQPTPPPVTKKEPSSKSSKSSKNNKQQQQHQHQHQHPSSVPSATPSTPSPRCQTPVTNNPSPAGSAFSTPPVNHPGGNNNLMSSNSSLMNMATMIDTFTDAQLQSNQISSTVLDSPYSYDYQTGSYIDSRNYYGQWPPPPHPPPSVTPNTHQQAPPMQHHDGYGNFGNPMVGTPGQLSDVRGEVKSRGSEENPDSTTIVNTTNLNDAKLVPPVATNLPEEGFVKPKPPPEYQYSQYPNNYQMYPPPPTYSPYDAYNNMNYNYGYHQPYTPYGMYPQQTPPTPPPPSPNWNMYPPSTSSQHPLPPPPHSMHHQQTFTPSPLPPAVHPHHAMQQQQSQQQTQILPPQQPSKPPPQQQQQQQQQPPPTTDIAATTTAKPEPIGEVTEINENLEAFQDPQMGGVAIALNHGSVLIECAKHEMHATTALKRPNRLHPTRMTLIFYQHRNLNRPKHGIDEWEEKMRLKKISTEAEAKAKEDANETKIKKEPTSEDESTGKKMDIDGNGDTGSSSSKKSKNSSDKSKKNSDPEQTKNAKLVLRAPTLTTTSWTTLFPMHPCVVTGPYQEGNSSPTSTTAATSA